MSASVAESAPERAAAAFRALRRGITRGRGFSLLLCTCDAPATRDQFIADLAESLPGHDLIRFEVPDGDDDLLAGVVRALTGNSPGPVMILGIERALTDPARAPGLLSGLNLSRTEWPWRVPHPVVFWLPRRLLGALTRGAPDFFDWRSDTIEVPELSSVALRPLAERDWHYGVDPRFSREEQDERLRELQARINATPDSGNERVCRTRLGWWDELAELKLTRGEVDEALRIRTVEELPVYERLGDVRETAVTRGKIADILQARGEFDEALRIRTDEQLPVYERLGDIDGIASVRFRLARARFQRGDHAAGGLQAIYEDLAESFALFQKLGRPDGIGFVGLLLAQVLALRGEKQDALAVLDLAESAFAKIGKTGKVEQVRALRESIRGDSANTDS